MSICRKTGLLLIKASGGGKDGRLVHQARGVDVSWPGVHEHWTLHGYHDVILTFGVNLLGVLSTINGKADRNDTLPEAGVFQVTSGGGLSVW